MMDGLRRKLLDNRLWTWAVVGGVLLGAAFLGVLASMRWIGLIVVAAGAMVLLQRPHLGLLALVGAALVIPLEFGTGTAVAVNPATMLVPALLGLWVLDMMRQRRVRLAPSRVNRPLFFFLFAGLASLLIGRALWDPAVPQPGSFIVVQIAQWAIFAFSAGAFWLAGNQVRKEIWLRRLVFLFLALAGGLTIVFALANLLNVSTIVVLVDRVATYAIHRSPFWMLLIALAGGQLLFNRELSDGWRLFSLAAVGAVLIYALYLERSTASNWVGVVAVAGVLGWLRWPRLRWPVVALLVALAVSGLLTSTVYDFAGGEAEWVESGGSRLALIGRVVELTMRNPITGLGPAAYRPYGKMGSLYYKGAYYASVWLSSHNNYVDLFSHTGLLGLGLFLWFAIELARLGFRLRAHFTHGFAAGFVNAMLASWAGALTLMLFADWILPFVYNIGFPGFQASVLVWLFLGGLVALEQIANGESVD